jgi:hypothetical protein
MGRTAEEVSRVVQSDKVKRGCGVRVDRQRCNTVPRFAVLPPRRTRPFMADAGRGNTRVGENLFPVSCLLLWRRRRQ